MTTGHEIERLSYAGDQGSFATALCVCGWQGTRATSETLWLEQLRRDFREHMNPDPWTCSWERRYLLPGGGAELADCSETALDGTEPPRCELHVGRP